MNDIGESRPAVRARTPRGFTLVELMIVVALIGLLAGIGVFTVGGTDSNRIAQLNRDISNRISEARSHAMTAGAAVYMEVDPDDDRGTVRFFEAVDGDDEPTPSCALATGTGEELAVVDVDHYGVSVELAAVDPTDSDSDYYCIGAGGRVTDENGGELGVERYGCTDDADDAGTAYMNLVMVFADEEIADNQDELTTLSGGCEEADISLRNDRELANFSMIHVGYGGQVRVIR